MVYYFAEAETPLHSQPKFEIGEFAGRSTDAIQLKAIVSNKIETIATEYDRALDQLVQYPEALHRRVVYLDIQSTHVSNSIRDRHNTEGDQEVLKLLGISSNTETPHTLIIRLHKEPPKIGTYKIEINIA
jgi:hypothetical protein